MLKIFLSSTYRDLADPRSKILQQLNSAFKGVGMEEFIPDGSDSQEVCIGNLKKMKDNGIVIFLISPYYGSPIESCSLKAECKAECPMKTDSGKISYTHCEYKTTKAEGILHQTYLVAKDWDAPDVKKEALDFKEEIGKEYLGFVDVEDPNLVKLICSNLATKIIEWHYKDKLDFTLFIDREKKLNEIMENIDEKVEVWGVGGVGKTALIEVALLIQKLKGKRILTIGTRKTYASGSGFKDFRDKSKEDQYIGDSPDQITIYDMINAFAKIKLIPNFDEILKMPSNEKVLHLSKLIREEKDFILFIDDFHLVTNEVVEIVKSVDHIILSSRKNSYIAKAIYLSGIDKEDREGLIELFSTELPEELLPISEEVKDLIGKIAEGHPVSTEILVKNYQNIDFNKIKDFDLRDADDGQVKDFYRRVIEEIFLHGESKNPDALSLLKNLAVINLDLPTNIHRESVITSSNIQNCRDAFRALVNTGMLIKRKGKEDCYEFYFKHIQEYLEDKIKEERIEEECHDHAVDYYEKKVSNLMKEYTIDDEVEVLYHKVKSDASEQLVDELLDIKQKIYPTYYSFKRLIHVGEELRTKVNERNKAALDGTLGNLYYNLKRFEEAETMCLNALSIYKKLAEQSPEAYLPFLAATQNNLGTLYRDLKRFEEAETMYLDALIIKKKLVEQSPDAYLPDVAMTQNNLGALYWNVKRFKEAETMCIDALNTYRKLAEQSPDAYLFYVGSILDNLGILYSDLLRFEEAETMYLESLTIRKKLAKQSPDAYLSDVAMTQNNLGILYRNLKRFEEAETMYLESLTIRKKLAKQSPDAYLSDVAMTQNNLGILYRDLKRFEEAETMCLAALNIHKKLAEQTPDAYLPDVADTQNNLGNLYGDLKRFEDAETMYLEALTIRKKLAEQSPDAYLPYVATTQYNLGVLYLNLKRFEEAETMYLEALNTYKKLAEQSPGAYLPYVANIQDNLVLLGIIKRVSNL